MLKKHQNTNSKFHVTYFVLVLLLSFIYLTIGFLSEKGNSNETDNQRIALSIDIQRLNLINASEYVKNSIKESKHNIHWDNVSLITDLHPFIYFVYHFDTLRFWNTHTVDQVDPQIFNSQGDTILQLNNGIFLLHQEKYNGWSINVLKQLQTEYQVANSLLKTETSDIFTTGGYFSLKRSKTNSSVKEITIEDPGIYKLYYLADNNFPFSIPTQILLIIIQVLVYLLVFLWMNGIKIKSDPTKSSSWLRFVTSIIAIISVRLVSQYFQLVPYHAHCSIFTDNISPISLLNSLGDTIINFSIIWILLSYLLLTQDLIAKSKRPNLILAIHISFSIAFIVFTFHDVLTIFLNNDFSMTPEILLNVSTHWKEILLIWLINIVSFSLIQVFSLININSQNKNPIIFIISLLGLVMLIVLKGTFLIITMLAFTTILSTLLFKFYTNKKRSVLISTFITITLLAITSAYTINTAQVHKENQIQAYTATMLAQKSDPLIEFKFSNLINKIKADSLLQKLVVKKHQIQDDSIENYLIENYINHISTKYNIQLTICDSTDFLEIAGENEFVSCNNYFSDLIATSGQLVSESNLFLINTTTENIYYLGYIDFMENTYHKTIYFEFVASYVPEGLGYPELIIDQNAQTLNLSNTSYARYYDQTLVYKFGDYKYPMLLDTNMISSDNNTYSIIKNYKHFTRQPQENETIMVSIPTKNITETIFPFSILFLLFSFTIALAYMIMYLIGNKSFQLITFRTKLQFLIIGTIIFTTVLLAIITMLYMQNNAENTTKKQLEEKTYSVFIELQHKLGNQVVFTDDENGILENLLKKFSLVFFSDINLYTPEGTLAATSRPEMEQMGLLSNMINPEAYHALMINHQLSFVTKEKIGSLSFYSAYIPLFLSGNTPAAIINLPFFARQSEIVNTFASLLANFINITVLIGIIGIIFSIILARVLTKPLLILQQRMAEMQIDRPNKSIHWKNNDEIGQLISQYNQMVEKLESSAELLKDSERESTWREMAQQIAHEIKNPLTPMKLNVQYLEKAFIEKHPDFQDRLSRTTKTLIEQIETLNNVAEMFGDVAKSSTKQYELIQINNLIVGVVQLFNNNPEINFITEFTDPTCTILAVEKDIIRVLNNLIKNAVQSFTDQTDKTIIITCSSDDNQVTISIEDNGKGISEEVQQNIFKPYFTTKTSGTGLGLAIVKSIVGENKGHISFISHPGMGTTFNMIFPVADKKKSNPVVS